MTQDLAFATWMSLRVSIAATLGAALIAVPLGAWLGIARFPGRRAVVVITNTLMATPTVLIGLVVYALLSRRGPLGILELLFTPTAIVFGEMLLALPCIVALTRGAIEALDPRAYETARTLGASRSRTLIVLLNEAAPALRAMLLSVFGRVVSELGIALMVGGNIRGETRTLPTAITLATQRGDLASATELGLVLLGLALGVMLLAEFVRVRR